MTPDIIVSQPGASPVRLEAVFAVTPARLFAAWTEADQLRQWFGIDPHAIEDMALDLKVGGQWRIIFGPNRTTRLEGHYLVIEPTTRLVFTWRHVETGSDGVQTCTPLSQVSIRFQPYGKATRLQLEHSKIVDQSGRLGVRKGWKASFKALALQLLGEKPTQKAMPNR